MFILKKIIAQLFFPGPLCLEILIAGLLLLLFTRKQRAGKIILSIGVVLFTLLSYTALSNIFLRRLEYQYPPLISTAASDFAPGEVVPQVRWIVVLGGGHTSDPKIPITSQLSGPSLSRLVEAVRLHNQIPGSRLILSEGKVFDSVPGAETMAEVAKAIGVKQEDLILESESKDTIDEARIIKSIVGNDKFILVTSASHMPRSMGMFKKLGMHPIAAPTDYTVKESQGISPGDFFPGSGGLRRAEGVIYEYLGLIWAKLRGQI
ncbi:MAG TPA: ElyC/SanA/YdcF family protein [Candidatus Wunengus sp. YC60]|uniref:ElyC/SanA/YdcF family protein n=1 Tax=Candidatus Wunengus sp. YC60 TaxID=3367697 RepID=UPI004027111B